MNNFFCSAPYMASETDVVLLVDEILEAYEQGKSVSLTLSDLTKAFDVVSHDLLLTYLEKFVVEGQALETLASSFLRDIKQVVSAGGAVSRQRVVKHGVPQGSVMEFNTCE